MFWPTTLQTVQFLPEVEELKLLNKKSNEDITYAPNPHKDEILNITTNHNSKLPFAILTYRAIYLFDSIHKSPINAHIRSDFSIEKFGPNESIKISPNGRTFAIKTSKNVILVYIIRPDSTNELLTIFGRDGNIIQNGYPTTRYNIDPKGFGGVNGNGTVSESSGLVKNFLGSLLNKDMNEIPVCDLGLRLKLILNVSSPMTDYCFVGNMELLLINSKPHAFQIIQLGAVNPVSNVGSATGLTNEKADGMGGQNINFILSDELDWFVDKNVNNGKEVVGMSYDYELDCFLWFNETGDALLVKRFGNMSNIEFKGVLIYKAPKEKKNAVKGCINHHKNLCYLALEDGELLIYKLNWDFTCTLLKTIKKTVNARGVIDMVLNPQGDSVVVLFENGWNIYSFLGNLNFSTFEYDSTNWSSPGRLGFVNQRELLLTTTHEVLTLSLSLLNYGDTLNSVSIKRPVLIDNDKISIFKVFEKKFIDHHHYNYNLHDITNKETNIWLIEMLPLNFRFRNGNIRSCSVSDDGNYVCIIGNYDVAIYDLIHNKWKLLEHLNDNQEITMTPVRECLWWKNYLLLGCKTNELKPKSEIIVFSKKIFELDEPFSFDSVIWGFNFNETPFEENFLNFNIDFHGDELLVMSDHLNCYTWKLSLKTHAIKKEDQILIITNTTANDLIKDRSMALLKSSILLQRSTVYQLKTCFKENDDSIVLNYGTVLTINGADLLFLTNTDLFYIKRQRHASNTVTYGTYLLSNTAEYVQKLSNSLISIFDGSQILHYNFNEEFDITKLKPIKISIGNDIVDDSAENYVVNSAGTRSYPITTIPNKNLIFGIQVDYLSTFSLKLETTRRNYLNNLVNHFLLANVSVAKMNSDDNALSISTVYSKFHKFKNFKFVLEMLMVDYIQSCCETKEGYDSNNEYFERLMELIRMTGNFYEIILNCIKKTEIQFWPIFFHKSGESPRDLVNHIFNEVADYKLSAHYFIIMLNYEREEDTSKGGEHSKKNSQISVKDLSLITNILSMLIVNKDFETSFELVRFLKIIDDKMYHKIVETLKADIKKT